MDVSVITVTYNSSAYISECLASIRAQEGVKAEIVAVDNASADGTAALVRGLEADVQLLVNRDNVGFGRACNQGFAASRGRFIFLLNPDARLVGRDALARLCRALQDHPRWGMAGTLVLSTEGRDFPPHTTYPGQVRSRNDFSRLPGAIAWVLGASMFVRREVYDALGGFDPDFFLYSEEIEFCLRLRKLGHEIGFVDSVEVRHIGGATEQERDPYDVWMQRMHGLYLFWKKHYLPEDVTRLVRHDRFRSIRRIVGYGLLSLLKSRGSPAWRNLRQWQAIRKAASVFLEQA